MDATFLKTLEPPFHTLHYSTVTTLTIQLNWLINKITRTSKHSSPYSALIPTAQNSVTHKSVLNLSLALQPLNRCGIPCGHLNGPFCNGSERYVIPTKIHWAHTIDSTCWNAAGGRGHDNSQSKNLITRWRVHYRTISWPNDDKIIAASSSSKNQLREHCCYITFPKTINENSSAPILTTRHAALRCLLSTFIGLLRIVF